MFKFFIAVNEMAKECGIHSKTDGEHAPFQRFKTFERILP